MAPPEARPRRAVAEGQQDGVILRHWPREKFDAFGQLRKQSDPDFGVSSYSYNEFGDLVTTTDALNRTTAMAYDRLGRVTVKTLPGTEGTVLYTYDSYLGSTNTAGKLAVLNDPAQTKVLSYDKLGRISKETRILKNPTNNKVDVPYITSYKIDLMNRNVEIDYPIDPGTGRGSRVCYEYNEMGYVNSIQYRTDATAGVGCNVEKVIITSTDYNEFGQVIATGYGNGVNTDYTYDIKGRLSRIVSTSSDGVSIKTLQDVSYTFAVDNNIENVDNNADDYQVTYSYSYDGLNRLVEANGNYSTIGALINNRFNRSYRYELNGNLIAKKFNDPDTGNPIDGWSYNYSNHAVTNINSSVDGNGRFTMSYDAVGNMNTQTDSKAKLTKQLEYDSYNRIRRVLNSNGKEVASYEYDDQGFRVRRRVSSNGGSELLYPSKFFGMDVSGKINGINNVYLNGLRVAAVSPDGTGHYFMADQVDSVHLVVDDAGAEVSRIEYMPYGETFVQEGSAAFQPKYNSQELDEETNFYFYNARYYDPQLARFVTADTVIDGEFDTQGWNRYMYVKGNPIIGKDPTGHNLEFDEESKTVTFTARLTDESGILTKEELNTLKTSIEEAIRKSYAGKRKDGTWKVVTDIDFAESNAPLDSRHTIRVVPEEQLPKGAAGGAIYRGLDIRLSAKYLEAANEVNDKKRKEFLEDQFYALGKVAAHELGHTALLLHEGDPSNLLYPEDISGFKITDKQFQQMITSFKNNEINKRNVPLHLKVYDSIRSTMRDVTIKADEYLEEQKSKKKE